MENKLYEEVRDAMRVDEGWENIPWGWDFFTFGWASEYFGILVPQPGTELTFALEVQSLNYRTARKSQGWDTFVTI